MEKNEVVQRLDEDFEYWMDRFTADEGNARYLFRGGNLLTKERIYTWLSRRAFDAGVRAILEIFLEEAEADKEESV